MMTQRPKNRMFNASYKRLDKEKGSDTDSGDETELFIKNKPQRKDIPTIEKLIEDGDTLQSLAIRYHCSIGDLKRLNNIHKENEIFAKRTIKVPHRPFTMALAGVHNSGTTSPNPSEQPSTSNLIDIESFNTRLTDNLLKVPDTKTDAVNEIIFNSHIQQKPCDRLSEDIEDDSCEEVHLLPPQERELAEGEAIVSALSCSGADGDISWIALIVCIVIVVFAIPLIYIFYIAKHSEQYHHQVS